MDKTSLKSTVRDVKKRLLSTFKSKSLSFGLGLHDDLLLLSFGDRLQPELLGLGRFPDVGVELEVLPLDLVLGDLDLLVTLDDLDLKIDPIRSSLSLPLM